MKSIKLKNSPESSCPNQFGGTVSELTTQIHPRYAHKRLLKASALVAVTSSILSLFVCTTTALAQDALWRSYYTSAQKEYQQGNYGETETLLRMALKAACKTDESLSAFFYLAHVCVKRQNYEEAERYYRIVLDGLGTKTWAVLRPPDGTPEWEQSPTDIQSTADTEHFFAMLKHRPQQLLTVKLAKPITIIDVLIDYGTLMQTMKRYQDSEQAFRQALILSDCRPDQAVNYEIKLLQRLAVLYQLQGRKAEGTAVDAQLCNARNSVIPNFDQVVSETIQKLDKIGHNPHALAIRLNNLALFCATHGDYTKAQTLFNRALSCLSEHPHWHKKDRALILNNYSDLLLAMGRVTEASNLLRESSALSSLPDVLGATSTK